jgi:hypothetical protein
MIFAGGFYICRLCTIINAADFADGNNASFSVCGDFDAGRRAPSFALVMPEL